MMKTKWIVGNWKMNGSLDSSKELVNKIIKDIGISNTRYVICPPNVYLATLTQYIDKKKLSLGAQDVSEYENGAYTGQVSAQMLKEIGCDYTIVGHSERRQYCFESDQIIAKKCLSAIAHNITPILCVGESLEAYEANQTELVILKQLTSVLDALGEENFALSMIAYEPIWAIGTGKTATPEQAQAVHLVIRGLLRERLGEGLAKKMVILYGGSAKPSNSADLLKMPDIDGLLVGGASLDAKGFLEIGEAAKIA